MNDNGTRCESCRLEFQGPTELADHLEPIPGPPRKDRNHKTSGPRFAGETFCDRICAWRLANEAAA